MQNIGTWFMGYTLVDVTNTGVYRNSTNFALERNQQRNWESSLQTIGLRTQPTDIISPRNPMMVPMQSHAFGSHYTGLHRCWKFMFYVEQGSVFGTVDNPTVFLEQDFDQVPIITRLTETAVFQDPIFYTTGIFKNVYFKVSFQTD